MSARKSRGKSASLFPRVSFAVLDENWPERHRKNGVLSVRIDGVHVGILGRGADSRRGEHFCCQSHSPPQRPRWPGMPFNPLPHMQNALCFAHGRRWHGLDEAMTFLALEVEDRLTRGASPPPVFRKCGKGHVILHRGRRVGVMRAYFGHYGRQFIVCGAWRDIYLDPVHGMLFDSRKEAMHVLPGLLEGRESLDAETGPAARRRARQARQAGPRR